MMRKKLSLLSGLILLAMLPSLAACGMVPDTRAIDLMEGITTSRIVSPAPSDPSVPFALSDEFLDATKDFSFALFRQVAGQDNPLVSPLSVYLALGMTANGANTRTLEEFEAVLGGGLPMQTLNEGYAWLMQNLPSSEKAKLALANSLWVREDVSPLQEFLQANADYYGAGAYRVDFQNPDAVKQINDWVKTHTDGQIDKVMDQFKPNTVMLLVNALSFDAEWAQKYLQTDVRPDTFQNLSGTTSAVPMMYSKERTLLKDDLCTGFVKPYADGYSFVALLPNEDVAFADFVNALDGRRFASLWENAQDQTVYAGLPKFSFQFDVSLNEALIAMGLSSAFDGSSADFSRLLNDRQLCIDDVIHKTKIDVHEQGTKAGAITAVVVVETGFMLTDTVILNRPFVYAIVEKDTGLPIFIGAVTEFAD